MLKMAETSPVLWNVGHELTRCVPGAFGRLDVRPWPFPWSRWDCSATMPRTTTSAAGPYTTVLASLSRAPRAPNTQRPQPAPPGRRYLANVRVQRPRRSGLFSCASVPEGVDDVSFLFIDDRPSMPSLLETALVEQLELQSVGHAVVVGVTG